MSKFLREVHDLLKRHYGEVSEGGIVEKSPSRLARGEGTTRKFFILKIDLVGSTMMLRGRRNGTYLKLVHTYLSTVDQICQTFGADPNQMEYAGDGLLAYFMENNTASDDVLKAAYYCSEAVKGLQSLDTTLGGMKPRCKVVLHYADLMVARIGPRANSMLTAIGHPIHKVAKMEKDIASGTGRATKEFYKALPFAWKKNLSVVHDSIPIATPRPPLPPPIYRLGDLLLQPTQRLSALGGLSAAQPSPPPQSLGNYSLSDVLMQPTQRLAALGGLSAVQPPPRKLTGLDQALVDITSSSRFRTESVPDDSILGYDIIWDTLAQTLAGS